MLTLSLCLAHGALMLRLCYRVENSIATPGRHQGGAWAFVRGNQGGARAEPRRVPVLFASSGKRMKASSQSERGFQTDEFRRAALRSPIPGSATPACAP